MRFSNDYSAGVWLISLAKNFEFDAGYAGVDHADRAGCTTREVNDASANERTAVVDADYGALVIAQVGDADACAERERAVGCGERVHIVDFSVGSLSAVPVRAVE